MQKIKRPQERFSIKVDNSYNEFNHFLLVKNENGQHIHPVENFDYFDFLDKSPTVSVLIDLENTPYKYVDTDEDLEELSVTLSSVTEFAVDLEHYKKRSYQGITCLMQISTRIEDFVIDTLKLRESIGIHLRQPFKDEHIRKVMHGANNDIKWLQRDFGIYVCNLFDTQKAASELDIGGTSLGYLLDKYCAVKADKTLQKADWSYRELSKDMILYARQDTHYLLHIYDRLRTQLLGSSVKLKKVYQDSYNVCKILYKKDQLGEFTYQSIIGKQDDLDASNLAVLSELYKWRDKLARDVDDTPSEIISDRTLVRTALNLPKNAISLNSEFKNKERIIKENDIKEVLSIICKSSKNPPAIFDRHAKELESRSKQSLSGKKKAKASQVGAPTLMMECFFVASGLYGWREDADANNAIPEKFLVELAKNHQEDAKHYIATLDGACKLLEQNATEVTRIVERSLKYAASFARAYYE